MNFPRVIYSQKQSQNENPGLLVPRPMLLPLYHAASGKTPKLNRPTDVRTGLMDQIMLECQSKGIIRIQAADGRLPEANQSSE